MKLSEPSVFTITNITLQPVEQLIPFCYQINAKCSGGTVFIEVDAVSAWEVLFVRNFWRLYAGATEPPSLGRATPHI